MEELLDEVRACTVCAEYLPHGVQPVVQASSTARVVIIGQAPGRRVHESGVPWNDPSGVRLREWLGLDDKRFYDPAQIALIPMGFCYPGTGTSGDKPPRPECAPLWHERLLAELPADRLELLIGSYAQARYLEDRESTLTATVAKWESYLPRRAVLPHPSPRNRGWLSRNPWFEDQAVPAIRGRVHEVLAAGG